MNLQSKSAALLFALCVLAFSNAANAMAINRCVRLVRNPQVDRETIVNVCSSCVIAKLERRRPGNENSAPTLRSYTLPPRSSLLLPFLGPGVTRVLGETACSKAR